MNCAKAHEYFIKHMDNCLSGMEAEWLDKHLMKCKKCSEYIAAYEAVLGALSEEEIVSPNDLEMKIMEQIGDLSASGADSHLSKDVGKIHLALGISFAFMMAMLPVILVNRDMIDEARTAVYNIYSTSVGIGLEHVQILIDNARISIFFDSLRYIILFVTMILIFIQLTIWRKSRAL